VRLRSAASLLAGCLLLSTPWAQQRVYNAHSNPVTWSRQNTQDIIDAALRSMRGDIEQRYAARTAARYAAIDRFLQMDRELAARARAQSVADATRVITRPADAGEVYAQLRSRADQGDRDSARMAATMLYNGMHAPVDKAAGLAMYRRAADLGDAESANFIGSALVHGIDTARDLATGVRYIEQGARGGSLEAAANLGFARRYGWDGKTDLAQAVEWLQRAAQAGNERGLYGIGTMQVFGEGMAKNVAAGLENLRQAERKGHADAAGFVAVMAQIGENVGLTREQALPALRAAADAGSTLANHHLGTLQVFDAEYRNVAEGRARLERNAAQGSAPAAWALCGGFTTGSQSGVKDVPYARRYCKQAADADEPNAVVAYIEHLRGQHGAPAEHAEADRYADRALQLGKRTLVRQRPDSGASRHYVRAQAQQAFKEASRLVDDATPAAQRDPRKAVQLFEAAAGQGSEYAAFALAQIYQGDLGIPADREQALLWVNRAADMEHPSGLMIRAQSLLGGRDLYGRPVAMNPDRGIVDLKKAAELGNPTANFYFGLYQVPGSGLTHASVAADREEGIRMLRFAAQRGVGDAGEVLRKLGVP
jgi:uncharacterized protein